MKRTTTIDQHQGDHTSGMRITKLVNITTEREGADQNTIDDIHQAKCILASLDHDRRARANEILESMPNVEVDNEAACIREAVRQAQAE